MQNASLLVQSHHGVEYLYVFGGFRSLVGAQKSFYRLNLEERRWESLPTGPEARFKARGGDLSFTYSLRTFFFNDRNLRSDFI